MQPLTVRFAKYVFVAIHKVGHVDSMKVSRRIGLPSPCNDKTKLFETPPTFFFFYFSSFSCRRLVADLPDGFLVSVGEHCARKTLSTEEKVFKSQFYLSNEIFF